MKKLPAKRKIRCALIGSGNIGTDLMYKLKRSPLLEPAWMVGIDPRSEGLALAKKHGLKTTAKGVDGLLPHVKADDIRIAFDATSAYVHRQNSEKLTKLGGNNILIVTDAVDQNLMLSARNLPHVDVSDVEGLNPVALLSREKVLVTQAALKKLEAWLS